MVSASPVFCAYQREVNLITPSPTQIVRCAILQYSYYATQKMKYQEKQLRNTVKSPEKKAVTHDSDFMQPLCIIHNRQKHCKVQKLSIKHTDHFIATLSIGLTL
jgi:hypothetical protein